MYILFSINLYYNNFPYCYIFLLCIFFLFTIFY
nr:MAG TPA: hypothetical protein [Ackermannviridae sp.]